MGVCKCTSAACIRCCIRSPEGPAAVSLGNDRKIAMRLISNGIEVDVSEGIGAVGHSLLGCLVSKSLQVSSLLGARPGDTKVWQALLYNPSWAREIADVTCCFSEMSLVQCCLLVLDARDNALLQKITELVLHPKITMGFNWDRLIMTVSAFATW